MALYHKLGVKTGFTFALQFFMLISGGLGGVRPYIFFGQSLPKLASVGLSVLWLLRRIQFRDEKRVSKMVFS